MFRTIEEAELKAYFQGLKEEVDENLESAAPRSIYTWKLRASAPNFTIHPSHIYFYYVSFIAEAQPLIRRYEYHAGAPIDINDVETEITRMARQAKNGTIVPSPTLDISGSVWTRKSYIVILMDNPFWTLHKIGPNDRAAVIFNPNKGEKNHTFFDGKDLNIDMIGNGTELRSAVYFVNHMKKNDAGEDITLDNGQPHSQNFKFDIFYDVTHFGGRVETQTDDPTGTNLGPPQP